MAVGFICMCCRDCCLKSFQTKIELSPSLRIFKIVKSKRNQSHSRHAFTSSFQIKLEPPFSYWIEGIQLDQITPLIPSQKRNKMTFFSFILLCDATKFQRNKKQFRRISINDTFFRIFSRT